MAFTTSPNMSLTIPGVATEPGPNYATDVNNSLTIIDGHNHSAGSGVLINPDGLNINADLPMNGNNLTLINTTRFQSLASPLANTSPNIGCLYVSGNELYYNDYSGGHSIAITTNGTVNGGAGSIGGLPSGSAGVNFGASTYVFIASSTVAANIDVGSVILRNNTPSSFGLTLQPPTLGGNYSLTLPIQPLQTNVMTLTSAGVMGSITYDQVGQNMTSVGANAIAASRTRAVGTTVGIGGIAISASGNGITTSSTPVAVTNLSVTITTSGRPVMMLLINDGSGISGDFGSGSVNPNHTAITAYVYFFNGASQLCKQDVSLQVLSSTNGINIGIPVSGIQFIDTPVAGTYTYTCQISGGASFQTSIGACKLVVYEL